jgi:hypothetical protein
MSDRASELAPLVRTKEEFIVFLSALSDDFRANPEAWENNNLSSFIEALATYAQDIDGYYKNFNLPVDASIPSWRVFAEILCGARVYE